MITPKGYRRIYHSASRRLRMEHDVVWEQHHGPIPAGFVVHHIDHDKERALDKTAPIETKPGRFRPTDKLLAFLEAL